MPLIISSGMDMERNSYKVCVTGSASYVGSSLVKTLLEKNHTVHATLRNLGDASKISLLKRLPGADTRLILFEADMYEPDGFEHAIKGCDFVFHVAAPWQHNEDSKFRNTTEASMEAAKSIALSCVKSGTVKKLIYTASSVAGSPKKDDGTGYKDSRDESCWTPLHLPFAHSNDILKAYVESKTSAEKVILSYNDDNKADEFEVVTLVSGLVGGQSFLPFTPPSVTAYISQITNNEFHIQLLRFLEELLGKIPIIHIDDLFEAHIFCMETPSISGRFFCASSFVSSAEIAYYWKQNYPEFHVKEEHLNWPKKDIQWETTKLIDQGFKYRHDTNRILDACVMCARRMGDL